jgi:hypothetical protein
VAPLEEQFGAIDFLARTTDSERAHPAVDESVRCRMRVWTKSVYLLR